MHEFKPGQILYFRIPGLNGSISDRIPCIFIKEEQGSYSNTKYFCCFMDTKDELETYCSKESLNLLPESMYHEFPGVEDFIRDYQLMCIGPIEDGVITRR